MFAERFCQEKGCNHADEVFEQIWCGHQKKTSDKRRVCQQAYLQDAEDMTAEQTEDAEEQRKRLLVFSHFPGTAVMRKESTADGQQEKANQETTGRTEELADTSGKVGENGNSGKSE